MTRICFSFCLLFSSSSCSCSSCSSFFVIFFFFLTYTHKHPHWTRHCCHVQTRTHTKPAITLLTHVHHTHDAHIYRHVYRHHYTNTGVWTGQCERTASVAGRSWRVGIVLRFPNNPASCLATSSRFCLITLGSNAIPSVTAPLNPCLFGNHVYENERHFC